MVSLIYCVTLQLRDFDNKNFLSSLYYESSSIRDLNDWLHHHICNSESNNEIVNLFFECRKDNSYEL